MENFNNVPSSGTFGSVVSVVNQNFALAKEAIDKLAFSKSACMGFYETSSELNDAHPTPTDGDWALVGNSSPFNVYVANDGSWVDSGADYIISMDVDIVNNLTDGGNDKALSGEMGKRIAELSQIIATIQTVTPQSVLTKSYVDSSGEIKASGTATTTVAYYPIDGNPLSVIIGKTANTATRVLSLAEDNTQTTGLVALTEKMGDTSAYEPSGLLSYSPKYKYLVVCYNNSAENVIKLNKGAISFTQLAQLLYLAREYSLDFDETKCIVDKCYIDYATGDAVTNSYWRSSDFIEIPEDIKWYNYITSNTGNSKNSGFAFYDSNKQFISGIPHASNMEYSGAIPSNAKYVRFCYYVTQSTSTSISLYSVGAIGFKAWLEEAVNRQDELVQKLSKDITKTYTTDDCVINGKFINKNNGDATSNSSFICSDFIETFGETIIVTSSWAASGVSGFCFYDSEKQYILGYSVTQVTDAVYQIPENAKYLRFTSKPGETNTFTMSLSGVDGLIYLTEHINTDEKEETKERHILIVGNSFTMHACEYLQEICNNLGVSNITLQYIYTSGASLKTYAESLSTTRSLTTAVDGGNPFGGGTLPNIFKGNWDIIVFQQASIDSPDYDTYSPYLRQLIDCALENCPNKDLQIMFNMTWAYSDDDGTMWQGILNANKQLRDDYGHIVRATIASGTAVANIRRSLGMSLSYDKHHLSPGVGRYVAGCILYTSLIMPYSGVSIYDDTTVKDVSGDSTAGAVSVTNDNRPICQQAVMDAYIDPWSDYIDTAVDPTPTAGSSKPVSSGGVYQALLGKSDKRIRATEIPVSGCAPDVVYELGITDNVTVTLEATSDEYEHQYTVRWTCRSSQCVITLPSNIKLPNGSMLEQATGRRFELVIDTDGYATVKYWDAFDAEIDYIESSGEQYIDTNIIPDDSTGIMAEVSVVSNVDKFILGCRNNSGSTRWGIGRTGNQFYYGYGSYQRIDDLFLPDEKHILSLNYLNDKSFRVGNSTIELPTLSFTPTKTIYLFKYNYTSGITSGDFKFYSVKITQGSEIVMDLIPVRVGTTGYMYDKISGQLFGNAGSGEFVLGEDI